MKNIIQFHIYKGDKYYIAEAIDLPVVTQAETLDELVKNMQEAVQLQLEDESLIDFNLVSNPLMMANLELDTKIYAQAKSFIRKRCD